MSELVESYNLGISIKEEDLANIDIQDIKNELNKYIDYNELNNYQKNGV